MFELILFFQVVFALITGTVASSKGRFALGWGILGALLGILAVIWIGLLPSLKENS